MKAWLGTSGCVACEDQNTDDDASTDPTTTSMASPPSQSPSTTCNGPTWLLPTGPQGVYEDGVGGYLEAKVVGLVQGITCGRLRQIGKDGGDWIIRYTQFLYLYCIREECSECRDIVMRLASQSLLQVDRCCCPSVSPPLPLAGCPQRIRPSTD